MKKVLQNVMVLLLIFSMFCINAEAVIADEFGDSDYLYIVRNEVLEDYNNGKFGDEVYYLSDRSSWGDSKYDIAVFKKDNTPMAVLYESDKRCSKRKLTNKEYNNFIVSMQEIGADSLADWDTGMVDDGGDNEYIHISKDIKASVYMNNPDYDGYRDGSNQMYLSLVEKFKALFETGKIETYYDICGAELLVNREEYVIQSVYKKGNDFRVLVQDKENSAYDNPKMEWHSLKKKGIGDVVDEPDGFTIERAWDNVPEYATISKTHNNYPWLTTWGDYTVKIWHETRVWSKTSNKRYSVGLLLAKADEESIVVCEGYYAYPVVIPNTDFVICIECADR